jgi:hypothetical protein
MDKHDRRLHYCRDAYRERPRYSPRTLRFGGKRRNAVTACIASRALVKGRVVGVPPAEARCL